jgi:hypothetical protein
MLLFRLRGRTLVEDQTGPIRKRCAKEGRHLMPKAIPHIKGFKFSFWSNENDEPIDHPWKEK